MKRKILVLLSAAAFLCAGRAYAHHSFAATYFVDKTITIEGNLVQFFIAIRIHSSRWRPPGRSREDADVVYRVGRRWSVEPGEGGERHA